MKPVRFLHVADVHLGATPYQDSERSRDYHRVLLDTVTRVAIPGGADFVIVAGDLFDRRQIEPAVLAQATEVFDTLRRAGIPVYAIEGNHDRKGFTSRVTWLDYLSEWGLVHLLEPVHAEDGMPRFVPWDPVTRRGSYLDHGAVRILGSMWYGSTTAKLVPALAQALSELPPAPYHLMMLHAGLDGFLDHYDGGLTVQDLAPLKAAGVDYLALGHIHKRYEADGWIYNPGSLEALNVAEYREERGYYWVEIDPSMRTHVARHGSDQPQRPVHRLAFDVTPWGDPGGLLQAAIAHVRREAALATPRHPTADAVRRPVVELTLVGRLGFRRHEIDRPALEKALQEAYDAQVARLSVEALPPDVAGLAEAGPERDRPALEREVLRELARRDSRYEAIADSTGDLLASLKRQVLAGTEPAQLADLVARHLDPEAACTS